MVALAVLVVGLAAVVARRQAVRLAAPLERLTGTRRRSAAATSASARVRRRPRGRRREPRTGGDRPAARRRARPGTCLQRARVPPAAHSADRAAARAGGGPGGRRSTGGDPHRAGTRRASSGDHRGSGAALTRQRGDRGVLDVAALLDEIRARTDVTRARSRTVAGGTGLAHRRTPDRQRPAGQRGHPRPSADHGLRDGPRQGLAIEVADTGPGIPDGRGCLPRLPRTATASGLPSPARWPRPKGGASFCGVPHPLRLACFCLRVDTVAATSRRPGRSCPLLPRRVHTDSRARARW